MKRIIVLAGVLAVVASGSALATPGADVVAGDLGRSTFDTINVQESEPTDVLFSRVKFQPGGFTGWHSHPGETFVVVRRGEFTVSHDDCSSVTYERGEVFHEPEGNVHIGVNEGDRVTVLFVTYFGVPVGGSPRIDEAAPACAKK
jgi:quercetin dioxygenase-like cupin family protein